MTSTPDMAQRIQELTEKLLYYNKKYYEEHEPVILDHEYDHLMAELNRLEEEFPEYRRADSPTQNVGESTSPNEKHFRHREKMLSIENVYTEEELINFGHGVEKKLLAEPIEWICELKIDGVAASLIYENGFLRQGLTRGDGIFGDDITDAVRLIDDVPKKIPFDTNRLEVRGEIYMENSELVRINLERAAKDQKTFANTRNVTAGTIKNLDPSSVADRKLRFFAHSVGSTAELPVSNHLDFMTLLNSYGFQTSPFLRKIPRFDLALEYCHEIIPELHRLDFEIDGIVIKVNDFEQRKRIGGTPKFPHWLIAYKFEKYEATTNVRDIAIQIGKTGTITPVAELEPIEIAGTIVSRASLHNSDEIERKDVRIGDIVVVEKAGKIIPHIVRVEKHLRQRELEPFRFPEVCPACKTPVKKDEGGVFIRCPNPDCLARFQEQLEYFASRNAMDIDGFGPAIVTQLTEPQKEGLLESEPLVQKLSDLYRLKKEDLIRLERKGERSAQKLIDAISESKTRGPIRLLNALSIRGIGEETSRLLIETYRSIDALSSANAEELSAIPSIGEKLASNLVEYFRSEVGRRTIQELKDQGLVMELPDDETAKRPPGPQILAGKKICVTGTLIRYKRDEVKEMILRAGGQFATSVTSKTDYLLAGEGEENGSKRKNAAKFNVPTLSEEEFFSQFPIES